MSEQTVVVANARLELLRGLAAAEDHHQEIVNDPTQEHPEYFPTHYPAWCGEWRNSREDILVAIKEAAALGEIEAVWPREAVDRKLMGPMLRITPQGYAAIRAQLRSRVQRSRR